VVTVKLATDKRRLGEDEGCLDANRAERRRALGAPDGRGDGVSLNTCGVAAGSQWLAAGGGLLFAGFVLGFGVRWATSLAAFGSWVSYSYARATWGQDADVHVTVALRRGVRAHGLSFIRPQKAKARRGYRRASMVELRRVELLTSCPLSRLFSACMALVGLRCDFRNES
jgi:hypothetical protein